MVMPHAAGEIGPENDLGTSAIEVGLTSGVDAPEDHAKDFVVGELQKLLRAELANPGVRRKQGPVILRDPSNPSNSVNLDDLVPGHFRGYKEPLVKREYKGKPKSVKAKGPLERREYRDKPVVKEQKIGGIDESKLMVARLRAALLAVSNGGNQ